MRLCDAGFTEIHVNSTHEVVVSLHLFIFYYSKATEKHWVFQLIHVSHMYTKFPRKNTMESHLPFETDTFLATEVRIYLSGFEQLTSRPRDFFLL